MIAIIDCIGLILYNRSRYKLIITHILLSFLNPIPRSDIASHHSLSSSCSFVSKALLNLLLFPLPKRYLIIILNHSIIHFLITFLFTPFQKVPFLQRRWKRDGFLLLLQGGDSRSPKACLFAPITDASSVLPEHLLAHVFILLHLVIDLLLWLLIDNDIADLWVLLGAGASAVMVTDRWSAVLMGQLLRIIRCDHLVHHFFLAMHRSIPHMVVIFAASLVV